MRRADGIARRAAVAFPDHFAGGRVQRDGFGARRTDVEAEDQLADMAVAAGLCRWRHAPHQAQRAAQTFHGVHLELGVGHQQPGQRGKRRGVFRGQHGAAEGFQKFNLVGLHIEQLHVLRAQHGGKRVADAARAADAADERHVRRTDAGFDQDHDVFAHRVEQAGEDGFALFALVGQVGHVGLEDDRAAAGERRGFLHVGANLAGLGGRQFEAFAQLAEEIAGALRAAAVLTEHFEAVGPQFQHGKPVAADGNHGGRAVPEQKPEAARLGLLGGNARQSDQPREPTADRRTVQAFPVEFGEQVEQAQGGFLVMLDELAAADPQFRPFPQQFNDLDGLGPDVDAEKALGARDLQRCVAIISPLVRN